MISEFTQILRDGHDLSDDQVGRAVHFLTSDYPDEGKADFLRALSAKGETPAEIAAFAREFLERGTSVEVSAESLGCPVIDVCGTGGDRLGLFNISTTAALVVASGGVCVAKHGNRGISSRSGGADVLEALGVKIDLEPSEVRRGLEEHRFAFLFAPRYHPVFKSLASVRRQLGAEGTITVFNLLGPLLNPVRPTHQLVGLFRAELLGAYAETLERLGRQRAWVINGRGGEHGMDEISVLGPTQVAELRHGKIGAFELGPELFVQKPASVEVLLGGDAVRNAEITRGILDNSIRDERRDIVVANAAAAFVVAGAAADLEQGIATAREQLDSGAARDLLAALVAAA